MPKHSEKRTGNAWRQDTREVVRQHRGVTALLDALGEDRYYLGEVLMELNHLQRYGVDPTVEMIEQAVQLVRNRHKPRQVSVHAVPIAKKARRSAGRFSQVPDMGEVVYYMRIGNRIKIGTTTNLRDRLATINPEELLALEVGGSRAEHERHREFADLWTHGEWFRYEGRLVAHIERLRATE